MLYKIKHGVFSYKYNNKYYIYNLLYIIITILKVGVAKYSDIRRKDNNLYDVIGTYTIDSELTARYDIIGLKHAYQEALINKDLLEAKAVRDELCEHIYNLKNPVYDYLKLQYYLENNDLDSISYIANKQLHRNIFKEYVNLLHVFNKTSYSTCKSDGAMYRDEKMHSVIHGNKVIIIGPLSNYGDIDIDSDAVIISLNIKKEILHKLPKPVDVAYMSSSSQLANYSALYDDINIVSIYWLQAIKKYTGIHSHKVRLMRNPSYLISNRYVPNMLQNILYDIVLYKPSHIELHGFDGYSTPNKLYNSEYLNFYSIKNMSINIRKHDPISNFLFTKTILSNYSIETDSYGTIFQSDLKEYLTKLRQNMKL